MSQLNEPRYAQMPDYVINFVGADHVYLGSDYPCTPCEHKPGKLIESLPFNTQVKEKLLSGAALEWLGLKKEQFVF